MLSKSTLGKLNKILSEHFGVVVDELKPEASLHGDLNAGEIELLELIPLLEEKFALIINEEEFKDFKTIGDIYAYFEDKLEY